MSLSGARRDVQEGRRSDAGRRPQERAPRHSATLGPRTASVDLPGRGKFRHLVPCCSTPARLFMGCGASVPQWQAALVADWPRYPVRRTPLTNGSYIFSKLRYEIGWVDCTLIQNVNCVIDAGQAVRLLKSDRVLVCCSGIDHNLFNTRLLADGCLCKYQCRAERDIL